MNSEIEINIKNNEYLVECEEFYIRINKKCPKCKRKMYFWGITEVFDIINTSTENHLSLKSPLVKHIIKKYNDNKKRKEFFCQACDKCDLIRTEKKADDVYYKVYHGL